MPKGSEKQKMKVLPRGKEGLPANQCRPICPWLADWLALVFCLRSNFLFKFNLPGCALIPLYMQQSKHSLEVLS